MTSNATKAHPADGTHYDQETGDYVMRGGTRLTPEGIYLDVDGNRHYGAQRLRIRQSDGAICPAIPQQDGADPRPLPPLVPTSHGWPTPPDGFGWPNLDNPNWND
ncbi:hypothetical protein [Prescottella equi]|uniref:hypothetical protein n=1 Tax=Rhodococcus hoagii TaxID=43767 RepID=UPI00111C5491|nr:hypothetical protein [Prescottella equi]